MNMYDKKNNKKNLLLTVTKSRFLAFSVCFLGVAETLAGTLPEDLAKFEALEAMALQITVPSWLLSIDKSDNFLFR